MGAGGGAWGGGGCNLLHAESGLLVSKSGILVSESVFLVSEAGFSVSVSGFSVFESAWLPNQGFSFRISLVSEAGV